MSMNNAKTIDSSDAVLLPGIDGSNPLGFLAALGLLRMLDSQSTNPAVRMAWTNTHGSWSPRVTGAGTTLDEVVEHLTKCADTSDVWSLDRRLPFRAQRLREAARDALAKASRQDRTDVDLLAGLGVECISDDKGVFEDTAFRMLRSADSGGNGMLAYARTILAETTRDQLRSTLAERWKYADEGSALRWDPLEDCNYAHQWRNPSSEKTRSVRAANRLGLEALAALPTVPVGPHVATAAFGRPDGRNGALTWPVWDPLIPLSIVKSLMTLAELQDEQPNRESLAARGVVAVYRSDRHRPSKYYSNFTPARRIA